MSTNQTDDVVVLKTQIADIEPVTRMIMQSWLETYVNEEYDVTEDWIKSRMESRLTPKAIAERQQKLVDNMNNPNVGTFVAKNIAGEVVGMTVPYRDSDGKQQVGALYVDKRYHGKGVAGKLIEKVFEWANPNEPIYLGVAIYNDRAKAFYKKWGFKEIIGSEQLHDNKIPEIIMVKEGAKS